MEEIQSNKENQSAVPGLEKPAIPVGEIGNVDVAVNKKETIRGLEILLGNQNLDPDRAEAIRQQIRDIDSGKISPNPKELGAQGEVVASSSEDNSLLRPEYLAKILNREVDATKIGQLGAGFDITGQIIDEAKRKARLSKN